jgi:hypothetical protein
MNRYDFTSLTGFKSQLNCSHISEFYMYSSEHMTSLLPENLDILTSKLHDGGYSVEG